MSAKLDAFAYEICVAIREEGAFAKDLRLVPNQQPAACPEVIAALRQKCPGLALSDYQAAIARGMHASR